MAHEAIVVSEYRSGQPVRMLWATKLDQWYVRQDNKGVVFLLNLDSTDKAHEMLEQFPLGQAHLMTFELIPLGPLSPLHVLLDQQ